MPKHNKVQRDINADRRSLAPGGGTVVRPGTGRRPGGIFDRIADTFTGGMVSRARRQYDDLIRKNEHAGAVARRIRDRVGLPSSGAELSPPGNPTTSRPVARPVTAPRRRFTTNPGGTPERDQPRPTTIDSNSETKTYGSIPAAPGVPHSDTLTLAQGVAPSGMIDAHETAARSGHDRNYIRPSQRIIHPKMGHGVRYVGKQPFADINGVVGTTGLMTGSNLATTNANSALITPDSLNGPLAGQANFHQFYRFNWIKWHYVTTATTSTPVTLVLAFDRDPAALSNSTIATTFATARQYSDNEMFPVWQNESHLKVKFDANTEIKSMRASSTGEPDNYVEGLFVCYPSGIGVANILVYGFLDVEYSIDMYGDCGSRGIAFATINAEERLILRTIFDKLVDLRRVIVPVDPSKKPGAINFEQVAKFLLTKVHAPNGSGEDGLLPGNGNQPCLKAPEEKKDDKKSWF